VRSPRDFFRPLAVGAPEPLREVPWRASRMIHFFDPSNAKMVAKVPDLAVKVDVLLGNLEDAVPAERKEQPEPASSRSPARPTSAAPSCGRGSTRSTRRGCSTT
jgi:hypothetical protein